jgi:hypothetical protein
MGVVVWGQPRVGRGDVPAQPLWPADDAPTGAEAEPFGYPAGPFGYPAGPYGYPAGPFGYQAGPYGYPAGLVQHVHHMLTVGSVSLPRRPLPSEDQTSSSKSGLNRRVADSGDVVTQI